MCGPDRRMQDDKGEQRISAARPSIFSRFTNLRASKDTGAGTLIS